MILRRHPPKGTPPSTNDALMSHHGIGTPKKAQLTRRPIKLAIAIACVGAIGITGITAMSAHANVFDSLLKILLPFYEPNPKSDIEEEAEYMADTEIIEPPDAQPDLGDEAMGDAQAAIPVPNLPTVLLDDTLIADDIEPMLDTPDLYALMDAEFAADRGDIARALTIYKAESFKQNATSVFERALSLSIEFETPDKSLAFATAWQDSNPEHIPAWFYVAHLALKAGEYDQAASMISTILHYDPRSDLGQILTGIIPPNADDKRALLYALQGLRQDNASVAVLRAGILMGLEDYAAARLHVNQALKSEPDNLAFITLKLNILRADQRMDELWSYLHQMRKKLPKEKELYLYEARYLIETGDLTQAWDLLAQAVKHTQDNDIRLLAGLVGLDGGRYREAIDMLMPLTELPDLKSQAHYYLGIGYERLGDIQQARSHFEKVNHYEHMLDASRKVVGFYLAENDTAAAIKTLVRLRDEFENYATDSYILQAEIYLRQGDKQKAKDLLTIANREYPDDDRLLYASFQLLEAELDYNDKRQAIDRLLQLADYNPYYQLADAKLRLSENPTDAKALDIARTISNISFDHPDYDSQLQLDALLVLANHALSQGDFAAVIDHLKAPYEVSPRLDVGITLLRAYQGINDQTAMAQLLADLQARFGGNDAATGDSQIY